MGRLARRARLARDSEDSTGGAIRNDRATERREIPGTATARARLAVTGDVHEVTGADARPVEVKIVGI